MGVYPSRAAASVLWDKVVVTGGFLGVCVCFPFLRDARAAPYCTLRLLSFCRTDPAQLTGLSAEGMGPVVQPLLPSWYPTGSWVCEDPC